jgi:hypothetical protein
MPQKKLPEVTSITSDYGLYLVDVIDQLQSVEQDLDEVIRLEGVDSSSDNTLNQCVYAMRRAVDYLRDAAMRHDQRVAVGKSKYKKGPDGSKTAL